ncbi:MAG: hypothetical protein IJ894_05960 [Bacteroidales bacterium]|nr:hypothetical protein [Bacteroidales bacterium]MBR2200277.1 hypothetical protein [Bacteroidales bacterium]MBR3712608.1 hypothetical protein [Bacteroidales bacterium]MBR4271346.1 hypothetical protein [Bacteroidales bacterium]
MKIIIHVVLVAVIALLAYLLWDSIMQPIRFQKKAEWRYGLTVQKLKDIRDAQVAYKSVYGAYTGSFDSLENFVQNGQLKIVKAIGNIPDSFYDKYPRKLAETKAIEAGIVKRDTVTVNCYDSLCKGKYNVAELRMVPIVNIPFEMASDTIETSSKAKISVFEAKTPNDVYLKGLDRQEIVNMNDEAKTIGKYPGLKVGSLVEFNNNAGNWE